MLVTVWCLVFACIPPQVCAVGMDTAPSIAEAGGFDGEVQLYSSIYLISCDVPFYCVYCMAATET